MNVVLQPIDHLAASPADVILARTPEAGDINVCVAEERPVAFSYNGFPHGVMMASPTDLEDFALGFSLTEGIVDSTNDIDSIVVMEGGGSTSIEISLSGTCLHHYLAERRVRRLSGNTSCGLCGVEDLADVRLKVCRVAAAEPLAPDVISKTVDRLRGCQPLSRLTRGAHAAAWVSRDGVIELVREDVGRHNALDKLIGAVLRAPSEGRDGFCLVTSRCSFEMVQKAVAASFSILVSVSSPTALAIRTAQAAGLTLYALSREGSPLLFALGDLS